MIMKIPFITNLIKGFWSIRITEINYTNAFLVLSLSNFSFSVDHQGVCPISFIKSSSDFCVYLLITCRQTPGY